MAKVILTGEFRWSPDGNEVIRYAAGEQDLPTRAAACARAMGLVKPERKKAAPKPKKGGGE